MSALELQDVVVEYERRGLDPVRAVAGASLAVEPGEIVGLVGESGCGKSTLARAAVGMLKPLEGSVRFHGREVAPLTRRSRPRELARLQMVFQNPFSSLNPRRRVGEQVGEALTVLGLARRSQRGARVRELLELVGLPAGAARGYPHEFSGGQRQRIAIARVLAADPSVIVLDEPLASLDASAQAQIANLLAELARRLELGLLLISHDLAIVRHVAHSFAAAVAYASPPLHRSADRRGAARGRRGRPPGSAARRGARPGPAADGLPFPSSLPVRVRPVPHRGTAAGGPRTRPVGRLLAARRRRAARPTVDLGTRAAGE
jgi:ABC-type glutathione transport system ATPase component